MAWSTPQIHFYDFLFSLDIPMALVGLVWVSQTITVQIPPICLTIANSFLVSCRKVNVHDFLATLIAATSCFLKRHPEDDSLDPTGDFKNVDKLCPKKAGQNPNDGAEEIGDALDWIRVNNKFVDDFRGGDNVPFGQLNSVRLSKRSPEERKKDVEDILDWIRSKKDDS